MNPLRRASLHLVATQRDRYMRAHGFYATERNEFRCQRMTACDSRPDNNESGERQREPIHTTALAEQRAENCNPYPDRTRELDSAQKVESGSNPSVRPVTREECQSRALQNEVPPTRQVLAQQAGGYASASRATLIDDDEELREVEAARAWLKANPIWRS